MQGQNVFGLDTQVDLGMPVQLQFARVTETIKGRGKTGREGRELEEPGEAVSLILLERPRERRPKRTNSGGVVKKTRPRPENTESRAGKAVTRSSCQSVERERQTDIEVGLDQAVLELSEIKAECHIEKREMERQLTSLTRKPLLAMKKKDPEELSLSADFPASIRETKLTEKLGRAESAMRVLYAKNQDLETIIAAQLPLHSDCVDKAGALEAEITFLSAELQQLQGDLTAVWEAQVQHSQDPAAQYTEDRIRGTIKDSKRYLDYYWALRDKAQHLSPSSLQSNAFQQILELEKQTQEADRKEFEQRLTQWEALNCELYVQNRLLQEQVNRLNR